jgi:hypothetical protein
MVRRRVACLQEAHGVRKQGLRGGQVVLKDLLDTRLQLLGLVEAEGEGLANLVHVDGTVPAGGRVRPKSAAIRGTVLCCVLCFWCVDIYM